MTLRTLLLISLSVVFPAISLNAQQATFDRANELLLGQQTDQAMALYRSIEEEGYLSGKLLFNMGMASVESDSLSLAKYYFLRAARFDETREEAVEALRLVENHFSRKASVLPSLPWERFFNWLDERLGTSLLLTIGLILLNLAACILLLSWFLPRYPRYQRFAALSITFLAFSALLSAGWIGYLNERYDTGIMVVQEQGVYSEPNEHSVLVSTAWEGYRMTVDRDRSAGYEGWYYVRLENGMYGWIHRDPVRVF
ncbi:MAG: hypothetical protein WDZ29_03000 [Balneolaceae bacterium]